MYYTAKIAGYMQIQTFTESVKQINTALYLLSITIFSIGTMVDPKMDKDGTVFIS